MKTIYMNNLKMYSVLFDEKNNKYFIEVVCGDIALYDVKVQLTTDEIEMFRQNPKNLDSLVKEINEDPDRFRNR